MRRLVLIPLVLAGCRFDAGGVAADDVVVPDAARDVADAAVPDGGPVPDAPPPPPDASIDANTTDPDLDDDTIIDALDNCDAVPNLDQHDEDGDLLGDVCDNCPHVGNATQVDSTEEAAGVAPDAIGDACDPGPDTREAIALFEPFKTASAEAPPGWMAIGGTWSVSGDELHQASSGDGAAHLYLSGESWTTMWTATRVDIDVVGPDPGGIGQEPRSAGPLVFFTRTGAVGTGYLCIVYDDISNTTDTVLLTGEQAADGNSGNFQLSGALGTGDLAAGQSFVMRAAAGGGAIDCEVDSPTPRGLPRDDTSFTSGTIALRTNTVAASFRYLVVFIPAT